MLRRNIWRLTGLTGNGVIGIRREDKNVWERRVPLIPEQVQQLLKRGTVKKVVVQPSSIRCYDDRAYEEAGAELNEDLSEASTIVAVKEVPPQLLIPERTYMFFSHTIKAQPYNMPLLDTILQKKVRLLDYERIVNDEGRMVKFGPYAGFGGMIDSLHALGLSLLTRGYATPFLHLSLSKEYSSLDVARADLREIGEQIRRRGLPKEIGPLTIAITGAGSVSIAAQQILHLLPCKYVEVEDLPKLWARDNKDTHCIHVVVVRSKDMVVPRDPSKKFSTKEYYAHPENFEPVFHENVAPYIHVLINGMYWEPRFPRLLTTSQARELKEKNRFPLLCLGDITCDVGGSVEFFVKATTIQNPLYVYNLENDEVLEMHQFTGQGVVILGVDHIPAEFPKESSTDFGKGLVPLVERVSVSDGTQSLEAQKESLGPYLYNAQVTNQGQLTPHYQYILKMRQRQETEKPQQNRILVFGAGMTSGPCVRHLLDNPQNVVTVVDSSQSNLDELQSNFGHGVPGLEKEEFHGLRTVKADLSTVDEYIEAMVKRSECVISLLPAFMHPRIAECTVANNVPLVTASYLAPAIQEIAAKATNPPLIINEMGLDPGLDIMTSASLLRSIRQQGGEIRSYVSLCGALCQPENSDCPMGYKFSWSPRGVLTAATRPTRFRAGGQWYDVKGEHLYHLTQPMPGYRGVNLVWVPNGDAEKYKDCYELGDDVEVLMRGTLRYGGYAPVVLAFYELGMLNTEAVLPELSTAHKETMTWRQLLAKLVGAAGTDAGLEAAVMKMCRDKVSATRAEVTATPAYQALAEIKMSREPVSRLPHSLDGEMAEIQSALHRLGLFGDTSVPKTPTGTVIDALCAHLVTKMSYRAHERDFVMMMHRITAYFPSKKKTRVFKATLTVRGKDLHNSATAVTVGVPVAAAAQAVLEGALSGRSGIVPPTDEALYRPVLKVMDERGIRMFEEVYDVE